MKYVAYHRTSTKDQHLDRGITELNTFCGSNGISLYKGKVYTDQQTGKNFDRPRYLMLKDEILEKGDCLIITEMDRLGRNKKGILDELRYFRDNDIRVMILEIPTTLQDLSKLNNAMAAMIMETINNMLIELYATMAEAEMKKKENVNKKEYKQRRTEENGMITADLELWILKNLRFVMNLLFKERRNPLNLCMN